MREYRATGKRICDGALLPDGHQTTTDRESDRVFDLFTERTIGSIRKIVRILTADSKGRAEREVARQAEEQIVSKIRVTFQAQILHLRRERDAVLAQYYLAVEPQKLLADDELRRLVIEASTSLYGEEEGRAKAEALFTRLQASTPPPPRPELRLIKP